ncbi:MAG: Uma2 family endonuclease [Cyanobacteria bacterium P01_G01_bin.54]
MVAPPITSPDPVSLLPTNLYSDEPPMETNLHLRQMLLLISCLDWLWRDRQDYFAAGNLTVYYSPQKIKSRDFRGPDFFVVLGTEKRDRRSWTVWEEGGKYPNVIVEILSDSTATVDRTTKKQLYQDIFRTPEYFWFDPDTLEFCGFILVGGVYEPIQPNMSGQLWSRQLELGLGVEGGQLRFFTPNGVLVPTPAEAALQAEQTAQQAEQAVQQAEQTAQQAEQKLQEAAQQTQQAQDQAERLAAKLRELGIDPDTV